MNQETWKQSKSKVLFLLKESHGFKKIRNRSHDISAGDGNHFWFNITRWWLCLDAYFNNQPLEFVTNNQLKKNQPFISDIAYVNVNKRIEGNSKSTEKDIISYAKRDKALLKKQIDLISPKVIITEKITFKCYKWIYENDENPLTNTTSSRVFRHNERHVIRLYHPSYFGKKASWIFDELQHSLEAIKL